MSLSQERRSSVELLNSSVNAVMPFLALKMQHGDGANL
jgi:hypothetical protein